MTENRIIKTYISKLDEKLGGGIPAGSVVLLVGATGTMKSSITFYIMYKNAMMHKCNCLYISVEQDPDKLRRQFELLGMDMDKLDKNISILDIRRVIEKSPGGTSKLIGETERKKIKIYETIKQRLLDMFRKKYDIIAIDSLSALKALYKIGDDDREVLNYLFELLKDQSETTSFVIVEQLDKDLEAIVEAYIADGVFILFREKVGNKYPLKIRCKKLRYMNHSTEEFFLNYDKNRKEFEISEVNR